MKIYTKKGDSGNTQLLGGKNVKKNNIRLECYGTIDELNAYIGHICDQQKNKDHLKNLIQIQNDLFNLGSCIAFDGNKSIELPIIDQDNIKFLEEKIDKIEKSLPALKNFILPSGHPTSSLCHIARTVCRRAERKLVSLCEVEDLNNNFLIYLNRLSDYLFVLSRSILKEYNIKDVKWQKK